MPPRRALPLLEAALGAVWWTVGSVALPPGPGTLVLAAGLGLVGAMFVGIRRHHGPGAPLPAGGRARLLKLAGIAAGLVVLAAVVLDLTDWGELTVPLACVIVGAALVPASSVLDARLLLATGGALMVVGAAGAVLALGSAGNLYPQGMVGLIAGALLWLSGALRVGLIAEVLGRARR